MSVHTQSAAFSLDAAPRLAAHGRRGTKRSKHFTQFLTCRTTPQKVQGSTHNAKSSYTSRFRKHPQLHLAAELARHPAAPGLLFTAAAVHGFSAVSKVVSKVVDKGSGRAETFGTAINRQLQQASNSIAFQAEVSHNSFQEWKGLMNGILSDEASKMQAELDHAERTAAAWQQHSSEAIAQVRDGFSSKPGLRAHPLGLPQMKVSELQSGWLVDALQERFPQAASSSAWPTSFSVAAGSDSSSDSMSFSDDDERGAASSPHSVSRFMDQARDLTTQLPVMARSRATALDRSMSEFGSAASSLVTSAMSKAAQLPGKGFGISNFSPSSSPEHASSRVGRTGPPRSRHLSGPASFTARLPSPKKAAALPSAPAPAAALPPPGKAAALPSESVASTAALTRGAASSPAAGPPSAPTTQSVTPLTASPARKPSTQKAAASPSSKLSPRKAMIKLSAGLPLAKTARSRLSTPRPPASPGKLLSGTLAGKAQAVGSPISSAAKQHVSSPPMGDLSQAKEGVPEVKGNTPQAKGDAIQAKREAPHAKEGAPEAKGNTHQAKGEAPQAKEGVPEAKGNAHQAKGEALQAKGEGAQHMASAYRPNAAGGDAETEVHAVEQQSTLSAHATPAQLSSDDTANAALLGADQHQEQSNAKTPIKPVRVVRPVPTPNWRAPRPLTPPPTPVQQGHPLSAPPPQGGYLQTAPGQQGAPAADSAGLNQDSAAMSAACARGPSSHGDSSIGDDTDTVTVGTSHVSGNTPTIQTSGHVTNAEQDQPPVLAGSSSGATEKVEQSSSPRQQPSTAAAAATAVDSNTTTTTVVDSIPWGSSGTATARGRQVSPQTGGGSGSSTGGTTGGGGGGSPRPSGDSGGSDDGHRSSSTWRQWWLGLLLVGGGATAISMSSAAKTAFRKAVAAIKATFASVDEEEQQQEEGEVHKEEVEDKEAQDSAQAEQSSHHEDGIATNIQTKEGDTAWSIAEEYSGGGTAWPEVVSSNPHANTAKPTSGMTLRVSVRM